jgi:hypothetical protein
MQSRQRFVRGLLLAGFLFALFFALEFLFEWWRLGMPGMDQMSWASKNNTKLLDLLSPMARAYNNILAMLLATIGLAIPLTANMHTPKLIEMFLRDRTNQIMLAGCAFGAANVLFIAHMIGPDFAPMWAFRVAVFGALAGWAVLIPYFFYVVRFLDPSDILRRLKEQVLESVDRGVSGGDVEECQDIIHERLQQIGTIVLKSVDRADRSVVLEGIWTLKQIMDHYGAHKSKLPAGWFKVDRKDFVGLSAEAIEIINDDRIWFEHKVMHQLYLAYQGALPKSADAISSISDATRVIACKIAERDDEVALSLVVRFFNNYLREAIKRRDVHAIYDLFYQYRLLGREAGSSRPELLRQIARYFRAYAEFAAQSGMPFVSPIAAFDLGWMVRRAVETGSPAVEAMLTEVLTIDHMSAGKPMPMVVKAKLALGGFFTESAMPEQAERLRKNLSNVGADALAAIGKDLLSVEERCFWEVTDRQVNFEWMPPERREKVKVFLDSFPAELGTSN